MLSNSLIVIMCLSSVALCIGIIFPKMVLPFAKEKSRLKVIVVYFLISFISFQLYIAFDPEPTKEEIAESKQLAEEAFVLFQKSQSEQAMEKLDDAIILDYNNVEAHYLRAGLETEEMVALFEEYQNKYMKADSLKLQGDEHNPSISGINQTIDAAKEWNWGAQDLINEIITKNEEAQDDLHYVLTLQEDYKLAGELQDTLEYGMSLFNTLSDFHESVSASLYNISEAMSQYEKLEKAQEKGDFEKIAKLEEKISENLKRFDELTIEGETILNEGLSRLETLGGKLEHIKIDNAANDQ